MWERSSQSLSPCPGVSTRLLLEPTGEASMSGCTWCLQSDAAHPAAANTAAACTVAACLAAARRAAARTVAACLSRQAPSAGSSRTAKQLQG